MLTGTLASRGANLQKLPDMIEYVERKKIFLKKNLILTQLF